jgi:hypothetical protein
VGEFDGDVREAVKEFWRTRAAQMKGRKKGRRGARDGRSAVTGGKQMNGFVDLVSRLLVEAGTPAESVFTGQGLELPGWFRAEKQWDLVVVHRERLLAAVEFKSQVGPSFGNNFNNRTEEALGSATDLWAAYREGAFAPSGRPFLGYLMLLEDCERSREAVQVQQPHFRVFAEFNGASYGKRYEVLVQKLMRDRVCDGACLLLSEKSAAASGDYVEPNAELAFHRLVRPLIAHVTASIRDA